jgi:DNA modification methylase
VIDLRLGDCLDVMRSMSDGCVDAVVMDPPFGIGFDYSGTKEVASTPDEYWAWLGPHYAEALRCLKPGGFIAVWQAALNFRHFWEWFGTDIRIYAACKNFVQIRKTPINYAFDPVVMRYKAGDIPRRPAKPKRSVDFFVANTAAVVSDKTRIEKGHPCPRPLDQVREIVSNFTIPGGVILDPFMGSGTGALACLETGRSFIGIENHEPYFAIAERRIAAARAKHPLFRCPG